MHVLTFPKALWIGEGGGAWSLVQLSLENSWLPSCCCCSAHCMTFLGSLWCEELLFVAPGPPACSLSTVCLQKNIYIKHSGLTFVHFVHVSILDLVDFFCFLKDVAVFFSFFSDSFVCAFSFLLLSDVLWWLGPSPSIAPDEAGGGDGICGRMGLSVSVFIEFPGAWVFLWTALVWDSSLLCEMFCCVLVWDDWMGQGKTSQSKCMWAGTWAIVWGWETDEPETTKAGEGGGPEAEGHDLLASLVSGWRAGMCGCVALCESSGGWVICCCYRWCRKEEIIIILWIWNKYYSKNMELISYTMTLTL